MDTYEDADWTEWVDEALALVGDHSMPLAVHEARALQLVEDQS